MKKYEIKMIKNWGDGFATSEYAEEWEFLSIEEARDYVLGCLYDGGELGESQLTYHRRKGDGWTGWFTHPEYKTRIEVRAV